MVTARMSVEYGPHSAVHSAHPNRIIDTKQLVDPRTVPLYVK